MIIKNKRLPVSVALRALFSNKATAQKMSLGLAVVLLIGILTVIFTATVKFTQPRAIILPDQDFYPESAEIKLNQSFSFNKNDIRYTLDGGLPTHSSPLYDQPLKIAQTTVVRAALFRDQDRVSPIVNKTVFIDVEHSMPIVSLITEPDSLWHPETGIYISDITEGNTPNYAQTGKEWERAADFQFYTVANEARDAAAPGAKPELVYDRDIGIRIHGAGSRNLPQKSLRLIASYQDERERFEYDFFANDGVTSHETLILRNAGTDWSSAFLRDELVEKLAAESTQLDTMPSRPVVVYLNGEYWGLYYLRERFDDHYFEEKYSLDSQRISILSVPHDHGEKRGSADLEQGYQSDVDEYHELLEQATACRDCARYNYFLPHMDLENFIDYNIFEFHFANYDWPYGNSEMWKYHDNVIGENPQLDSDLPYGLDGRYRWLLFDLDVGLGFGSDSTEEAISAANSGILGLLIDDRFPFRNLFYDPTFQENYLNHYANLLNTTLSKERAITVLDEMEAELIEEMPRQIERWKNDVSPHDLRFAQSVEEWQREVDIVRTYLEHRPEGVTQELFREFYTDENGESTIHQQGMVYVTLDVNEPTAGDIKAHRTIFQGENAPYDNRYFPQQFITFTALPSDGWQFSHWEGDVEDGQKNNPNFRVRLRRDLELTAVFEKRSSWLFNL